MLAHHLRRWANINRTMRQLTYSLCKFLGYADSSETTVFVCNFINKEPSLFYYSTHIEPFYMLSI